MPRLRDIVGQARAIQALRRVMRSGRMANAYLLSGPDGVGKRTLAMALAAALNCHDQPAEGCDECLSCAKISDGQHPDLMLIAPDGQFIKIDQVRALQEHLHFAPNEARVRVVILDGADRLNTNAGNALLKSVEEPRPDTVFALVAAAAHRVLPTLRSRCQQIRLCPLPVGLVAEVVGRHAPAERTAEERAAAVAVAEGSPGRALRLLDSEQLGTARAIAAGILEAVDAGDGATLFAVSEQSGKERGPMLDAVELLRIRHRDLLLLAQGDERVINRDQIDRLRDEAARLDRRAILGRLRALQEAQSALLGNVSPRLTLETLVLGLQERSGSIEINGRR